MTEPCGAAGVDDGVFVGVGAVEVTTVAAEIVVTSGTVSAETVMSVAAVVGVVAEAITTVDLGTVGPVAATRSQAIASWSTSRDRPTAS